ncbi:MAG: TolC family protein, partial [Polyangiaceae bacterium]|nr:TolC family protein [Polyangiaceae bacterium]
MRTLVGAGAFVILAGSPLAWDSSAYAQDRQPLPAPPAPTAPLVSPPPPSPPNSAPPSPPAPATVAAPSTTGDDTAPLPVPADLTKAQPGGITAARVFERAAATSFSAKVNEEALRGAAARVDQAWAAFLPRLSGVAKYTRLSVITPPNLGTLVVPADPNTHPGPFSGPLEAIQFKFPFVFNNWLFQASITVPISDYFLSINQRYSSATHSEDAARWDVASARAVAGSNGSVAYYTWLRARGAVIVAVQALNDQRTHLRDARNQFAVGNASKADELRAETAVSSAELTLVQAQNMASLSEKQLRVALHMPDDAVLAPGEDLEAALPPELGNVEGLIGEAVNNRPE